MRTRWAQEALKSNEANEKNARNLGDSVRYSL